MDNKFHWEQQQQQQHMLTQKTVKKHITRVHTQSHVQTYTIAIATTDLCAGALSW